jgi:chemotaxis signal transduction protein
MTPSSDKLGRESDQICVFRLGESRFGVPAHFVQELVREPRLASVPLAPTEIAGIFSLRGTPVVALDAASLIDRSVAASAKRPYALVLLLGDVNVALGVDEVDSVTSIQGCPRFPVEQTEGELRSGFVELPGHAELIALIDAERLQARIRGLRFVSD